MTKNMPIKVVFGCDHGGLSLREALSKAAENAGCLFIDASRTTGESVDYPDESKHAIEVFEQEQADFLVLTCGSGVGVSMTANRYPRIRAVMTENPYMARLSRGHNHANCLCLGARTMGHDACIATFLEFIQSPTDADARHVRRVQKMEEVCPTSS